MQNTYWNHKGKYQAEYDRLVDAMPASGNCKTVAGEMIRAASRLGYDFYNNGMGNNTSGAANYLLSQGAIDRSTFDTVFDYARGRMYEGNYNGDSLQVAIESVIDQTIEMILENPELETTQNDEDMFDYEDEEQSFCEGCGDVLDDVGWGHLCEYCEEMQEEEEEDDY